MKTKLFIIITLIFLNFSDVMAGNYRDLVKQLVAFDTTAINLIIEPMRKYVSQDDSNTYLTEKFGKYVSTQLADDIVDITLQCYRDNMTEAQLRELISQNEREWPEVETAFAHISTATSQMTYDIAYMVGRAMGAFVKGRELPNMPDAAECSDEYRRKFEAYLDISDEELRKSYEAELKSNDEIAGKPLSGMISFLVKATKVIALNAYVKTVAEGDFDVIARLTQTDAYRARMNAVNCINFTHPKLLDEIKARFETWAKAQ